MCVPGGRGEWADAPGFLAGCGGQLLSGGGGCSGWKGTWWNSEDKSFEKGIQVGDSGGDRLGLEMALRKYPADRTRSLEHRAHARLTEPALSGERQGVRRQREQGEQARDQGSQCHARRGRWAMGLAALGRRTRGDSASRRALSTGTVMRRHAASRSAGRHPSKGPAGWLWGSRHQVGADVGTQECCASQGGPRRVATQRPFQEAPL